MFKKIKSIKTKLKYKMFKKIKTKKKKKKLNMNFLLCIVAFLTIIVTFLILYFFFKPQQVVEYRMTLIIGDHSGFDLNRTAITFGMIAPSGSLTRHLSIKNSEEYKNKVIIKATGNLVKWVSVSDNNFILQPYEVRIIDISATAPADAKFGNYSGTLRLNFLKRESNFVSKILEKLEQ